jgi:hypothetical protein
LRFASGRFPATLGANVMQNENEYKVKLEVFEGPLDLLLYLIKKDEIDIYDIPIERITRQYLEYLDAFKVLDIDIAGDFVVMAANLIYIKSRSLLPVHQQPPDEMAEEEDPDPRGGPGKSLRAHPGETGGGGGAADRRSEHFRPHQCV